MIRFSDPNYTLQWLSTTKFDCFGKLFGLGLKKMAFSSQLPPLLTLCYKTCMSVDFF